MTKVEYTHSYNDIRSRTQFWLSECCYVKSLVGLKQGSHNLLVWSLKDKSNINDRAFTHPVTFDLDEYVSILTQFVCRGICTHSKLANNLLPTLMVPAG